MYFYELLLSVVLTTSLVMTIQEAILWDPHFSLVTLRLGVQKWILQVAAIKKTPKKKGSMNYSI